MTIAALVAILVPDGDDLRCCGTGTLLASRAVVVHPPLSHRIFERSAIAPTRVAVCSWSGGRLDVLEVAEVHVADDLLTDRDGVAQEPVVSLELSADAPVGTGCRGFVSEDDLLSHLRDPFPREPPYPWSVFPLMAEGPAAPPGNPPGDVVVPDDPVPPILVDSNFICRFIGFMCR